VVEGSIGEVEAAFREEVLELFVIGYDVLDNTKGSLCVCTISHEVQDAFLWIVNDSPEDQAYAKQGCLQMISWDDNDETFLACVIAINEPLSQIPVEWVLKQVIIKQKQPYPIGAALTLGDDLLVINAFAFTDLTLSQSIRCPKMLDSGILAESLLSAVNLT